MLISPQLGSCCLPNVHSNLAKGWAKSCFDKKFGNTNQQNDERSTLGELEVCYIQTCQPFLLKTTLSVVSKRTQCGVLWPKMVRCLRLPATACNLRCPHGAYITASSASLHLS